MSKRKKVDNKEGKTKKVKGVPGSKYEEKPKVSFVDAPKGGTTASEINEVLKYQLDGKLYNKRGVKSIDELLGDRNPEYRDFKNVEEYEDFISNLNLIDLHEHATKLAVLPKEDKNSLIKTLVNEFRVRNGAYFGVVEDTTNYPKPITAEVAKILAEGK